MKYRTLNLLIFFALFTVLPLFAQSGEAVSSVLEAFRITTDQAGEEIATKVEEVTPGDLIEYRLTYTNNLGESISQLQPVLPVPMGMEYQLLSAEPVLTGASLSNSGTDFQPVPLTRQVRDEDGNVVTREVSGREYRRLRWTVETLGSGQEVLLTARVRVISN